MVLGSASVTLIATLESLTVTARPMAAAAPSLERDAMADAGSLAITSSWAAPANLTTVRMVWVAGGGSADQIDEMRAKGAEGRVVYAQRAGESNRAFTRTDTLHVENKAPVSPVQHSNPGRSSVSVVVQAL